jgi:ubiquinone/menaquinone biosynthesis C-methylase UbiE
MELILHASGSYHFILFFQEDFKYMIEDAGFCQVSYENLSFGVVAIHSGFKL